jgi:hypothetical protein
MSAESGSAKKLSLPARHWQNKQKGVYPHKG